MLSLEPLRANETKLEIFERWMKWAKAGHDDSIFIETLDLMGLRRPVLLRWRQAPESFSLPTSTITSTVEASASPKARLPFPREQVIPRPPSAPPLHPLPLRLLPLSDRTKTT